MTRPTPRRPAGAKRGRRAAGQYAGSRFNAARHGVLSRHAVLPWEDAAEYETLRAELAREYRPEAVVEHHLVEEIAGVLWRKRRLALAEIALHRKTLHEALDPSFTALDDRVASRALTHLTGGLPATSPDRARDAVITTPAETTRQHEALEQESARIEHALALLAAGAPDVYPAALAALPESIRAWWADRSSPPPSDDEGADGEEEDTGPAYPPDGAGLWRFLETEVRIRHARRSQELARRPLIREQAFGESFEPGGLLTLARYETHLDRKLGRVLSMLTKLQELRRTLKTPSG